MKGVVYKHAQGYVESNSLVVSSISSSIGSCQAQSFRESNWRSKRLAEVWLWVHFWVRELVDVMSDTIDYHTVNAFRCDIYCTYLYICNNVHVFEYVYKLYICMYSIISPNGCLWYVLIWFASSWGDPIRFPNCRRERYAAYAVHRPGEPGGHVAEGTWS